MDINYEYFCVIVAYMVFFKLRQRTIIPVF